MTSVPTTSQLFDFLFTNRLMRTKVPEGERLLKDEGELAYFYNELMLDSKRREFKQFLSGLGFEIQSFEGGVMKGLPADAVYFVLVRNSEKEAPAWLDLDSFYTQVARIKSESQKITKVWCFVIWMTILSALYTKKSRTASMISRYVDSEISDLEISNSVLAFLTTIFSHPPEEENEMLDILRHYKTKEVSTRVQNYLSLLCRFKHLKKIGKVEGKSETIYRQTLLGAAEIAEHESNGLAHLAPPEAMDEKIFEKIIEEIDDIGEV